MLYENKHGKKQQTIIYTNIRVRYIHSMLLLIVNVCKRCIVNKAPKFFLQLESSLGEMEICLADDYLIKEYGVCM